MKKSFLGLVFMIGLLPGYTQATPIFSEPVLQKAYEQVQVRIDAKISQTGLDASTKAIAEQKKAYLKDVLVALDRAYQKRDKKVFKEQIRLFQNGYKEAIIAIDNLKTVRVIPNDHKNIPKTENTGSITGKATDITYYSDSFEWGGTANGNPFSQSFYSAAACNIPFNTLVQVGKWDKSVIVKVNDRPNCAKYPNLTDLTSTAFRVLGNLSSGKLPGTIQTLGTVSKSYVKRMARTDAFKGLGIELDAGIPNTYLRNETLRITGKELLGKENTLLYIESPSGKVISLVSKKGDDGRFEYSYPLEEIGTYSLVIASGMGFSSTSLIMDIFVLDDTVFEGKKYSPAPSDIALLDSLDTERVELPNLVSIYLFHFGTKDFHTLTLTSGDKTLIYRGFETIAIRSDALSSFDTTKPIQTIVTSQKSSTAFSHDTYTAPVTIFQKTMTLTPGYREEKNESITSDIQANNLIIHGMVAKGKNVKSDIILTLPDGNVAKYAFDKGSIDTDGYLKRGKVFEKTIPLTYTGVYLVEVNYSNGFAAYNGPVTLGDVLPVAPNDMDTVGKDILDSDASVVARESLDFINAIRAKSGKKVLVLDETLNALALIKAKDMAKTGILSHQDSAGVYIDGTAKRNNIAVAWGLGENIAGGNLSFRVLLIGLANSGGHRTNMLDDWTRLGIGYTVKGGQVYYDQVFGE